jgi:hypothetical protein
MEDFGHTLYGVAVAASGITFACGIDDNNNKNYISSYAADADGLATPLCR